MKQDEQSSIENSVEQYEQYDTKGGPHGPTRRGSVQVGGLVIENPLQVSQRMRRCRR